jgi:hypothetical protein
MILFSSFIRYFIENEFYWSFAAICLRQWQITQKYKIFGNSSIKA